MANDKSNKSNVNNGQRAFDDAKARARGQDPEIVGDADVEDLALVSVGDAPEGVIRAPATAAEMESHFRGKVQAPIFIKLQPGQVIEGRFVRWGEVQLNKKDAITGEHLKVATIVLNVGGMLVEFLSAHELNGALHGCEEGVSVTIARGKTADVGDRRVTRYRVAFGGQ